MCCDIARNDGTGDPRAARPVNADWLRQVALAVAADSRVVQPGLLAVGAAGKVVVLAEKAEGPGCRAAAALRPDFRGLLPAGVGEVPVDPGRGISRPGARGLRCRCRRDVRALRYGGAGQNQPADHRRGCDESDFHDFRPPIAYFLSSETCRGTVTVGPPRVPVGRHKVTAQQKPNAETW